MSKSEPGHVTPGISGAEDGPALMNNNDIYNLTLNSIVIG
jgi:hypothetical protein